MPVSCFRESKASDVLDHLIAHQDAWPFEEPVDMDEVRILSSLFYPFFLLACPSSFSHCIFPSSRV